MTDVSAPSQHESVCFLSLSSKEGHTDNIAYVRRHGHSPVVVFLNGFHSVMTGRKATAIEEYCKTTGNTFVRFDNRGCGQSSGKVTDFVLGDWIDDALLIIDTLAPCEPVVLVGSSMGGWISFHVAMKRKEQVLGIVGVAAAPDFVQRLLETNLSNEHQREIDKNGFMHMFSEYSHEPYIITTNFIKESQQWNILKGDQIDVNCKVFLVHGKRDKYVTVELFHQLCKSLSKTFLRSILVEDGDHRLSSDSDLVVILSAIEWVLNTY